ncbi:MAG: energy transducer TonB [Armatimonadota bacterium]
MSKAPSLRLPLAASVVLHFGALTLLGVRIHVRGGIDVERLRVVDVVVTTGGLQPEEVLQEQVAMEKQEVPPPQATAPKKLVSEKPLAKLPTPVQKPHAGRTPLRAASAVSQNQPSYATRVPRDVSKPPGDPGGPLNLGSTSSRGEDLGPVSGTTPVGWVPNPEGRGTGMGSGEGAGVGTPEPPAHADPGPGRAPNPAPVVRPVPRPEPPHPPVEQPKPKPEPVQPPPRPKVEEPVRNPEPPPLPDRAEPELVYRPNMSEYYPPACREEGVEGDVTLLYTVSEDGSVTDVQVVRKSGDSRLDRAAVRAAMAMKYRPAVQNGKPRAVKRLQKFEFRLE